MKQTTYGKGARGKATRLHSQVVRARGRCENCGTTQSLQCAHIVSRRYAATRTDENNAFCLCAGCHLRFTDHPFEWVKFVLAKIGVDGYDTLRAKAEAGVKANDSFWKAECERLAALLREVVA